jgi:sporulation protein YlmC with PRC-barrel domain
MKTKGKGLLTASAMVAVLTTHLVSAQAQDQSTRDQNHADRQATREHRLGRILPADRVVGREVVNRNGKELGKIEDAVMDLETGRILFVVLNVSQEGRNDSVAVPPMLFTVAPAGSNNGGQGRQPFGIEVGREALANAPKFDKNQSESIASAAFLDQVYKHFNQATWWAGAAGSTAGEFKNVHRVSRMNEFTVQDVANAKLGKINTVLLDVPAGRVTYAILDPANRISEKQELVPVPPMALTKGSDKRVLVLDSNQEKLKAAPKIDRGQLTSGDLQRLAGPEFAKRVYDYYGKKPWFEESLAPTGAETGRPQQQ